MDPNLETTPPGKRRPRRAYDPYHRDDFWDAEDVPEPSTCKSNLF